MDYYVMTFSNTHGAISCQKHLKEEVSIVVLPAPREISLGCGIGIRFAAEDYPIVVEKLNRFPLDKKMYNIHHFVDGCYTSIL